MFRMAKMNLQRGMSVIFLVWIVLQLKIVAGEEVSKEKIIQEVEKYLQEKMTEVFFPKSSDPEILKEYTKNPMIMKKKAELISSIFVEALEGLQDKPYSISFLEKAKKDSYEMMIGHKELISWKKKDILQNKIRFLKKAKDLLKNYNYLPEDKSRDEKNKELRETIEYIKQQIKVIFTTHDVVCPDQNIPPGMLEMIEGALFVIKKDGEKKRKQLIRKYLGFYLLDCLETVAQKMWVDTGEFKSEVQQ